MGRVVVGTLAVLVIGVGVSAAEETKGKVVSLQLKDIKNGIIQLDVKGKELSFVINDKTKALDAKGEKVPEGLKDKRFTKGREVTVVHEKDRNVAQEIRAAETKPK